MKKSEWLFVGLFALLAFALHLAAVQGYGYFRDELYYLACADHPAFGYVDQPPLSIFLLKLIRFLLGDSRLAIRLLPALGHAAFILLAGLMAKALGGRKTAVTLSAAGAFAATGNFFVFHNYSMNFIDLLFWQALILIALRIFQTGRSKLWILFGAIAGLGLQNKTSVLIFLFGFGVGLLLTKHRREIKNPSLWIGGGIAALVFLPYVLWNAHNDWPALEFIRNAALFKNVENTPLGFLRDQILFNNPLTLPLWLSGLFYFFFHKEGRRHRIFGWMYAALFLLFTLQNGKDYYLAGAYLILFAGGGAFIERWIDSAKRRIRWIAPAFAGILAAGGLALSPFGLPILPAEKAAKLFGSSGLETGQERQEIGLLPQHFADQFGWEEMAVLFGKIHQGLSAEERPKCFVFLRNYGEAAAIDFFGRKFGLPKASCGHNSYWFWGPPDWDGKVAIIMGASRDEGESFEDLSRHFESVIPAGRTSARFAMPFENNRTVFLCRGFRGRLKDSWGALRHLE